MVYQITCQVLALMVFVIFDPKARDGKDQVELPDGQYITKQCYWLNREYIAEIVKEL